eukprot:UN25624
MWKVQIYQFQSELTDENLEDIRKIIASYASQGKDELFGEDVERFLTVLNPDFEEEEVEQVAQDIIDECGQTGQSATTDQILEAVIQIFRADPTGFAETLGNLGLNRFVEVKPANIQPIDSDKLLEAFVKVIKYFTTDNESFDFDELLTLFTNYDTPRRDEDVHLRVANLFEHFKYPEKIEIDPLTKLHQPGFETRPAFWLNILHKLGIQSHLMNPGQSNQMSAGDQELQRQVEEMKARMEDLRRKLTIQEEKEGQLKKDLQTLKEER